MTMPKIKVLIADDHAVVREGTRQILEQQEDMDVVAEAADGEEAIRLAGDLQFFLEEKERVTRFEQAIQNLSASEAEMLAGILREKLNSPEM